MQQEKDTQRTYPIDTENVAEVVRLKKQGALVTNSLGSLLPRQIQLEGNQRLLDIACGPGEWTIEMAHTFSSVYIVGVDLSARMIEYASTQAQVQEIRNLEFRYMDALKPFDFPDGSFDIVHGRMLSGFILPTMWQAFLRECWRVLAPGGYLCWLEPEMPFTNSEHAEQMVRLSLQASARANRLMTPGSRIAGITVHMCSLLRKTGFDVLGSEAYAIEFSHGTEAYTTMYEDYAIGFKLVQPALMRVEVATQAELDQLYERMLAEMQDEAFVGLWPLLRVCAQKPIDSLCTPQSIM